MTSLVNGVVLGRVTAVDPSQDPGWVEIEFHVEEGNTRTLARIATAMAGDQRGTWLMPEQGDEVVVAFQNGHPASPYVIGYLWNGGVSVPESASDKRVLKSKLGHTVTFDDSSGNKVEVRSNNGHTVTLDDANQRIEIKTASPASNTITMDSNGIKLRAGGRQVEITTSTVAFT